MLESRDINAEPVINQDEYSWFKMHYRNFKSKTVSFVEEFLKTFTEYSEVVVRKYLKRLVLFF